MGLGCDAGSGLGETIVDLSLENTPLLALKQLCESRRLASSKVPHKALRLSSARVRLKEILKWKLKKPSPPPAKSLSFHRRHLTPEEEILLLLTSFYA